MTEHRCIKHGPAAIAAAALMMFALGALYAWSVFIHPLELALTASRAEVSAVFSVATLGFTAGMLTAPLFYRQVRAPGLAMAVGGLAGLGHLIAASLDLRLLLLGYGALFGYANGIGYSLAVQSVQIVAGTRRGRWTGIIVACHTLGAACLAPLFNLLIGAAGTAGALAIIGFTLLAACAGAAALFWAGGLQSLDPSAGTAPRQRQPRAFALLWVAMFFGSLAGVFGLGHAAEIQSANSGGAALAATAAALVAIGNGLGRVLGGWSGESGHPHRWVAALQLGAALALGLLAAGTGSGVVAAALFATGVGYGWMAGAYPLIVARYWGAQRVGRVYGRLFTSWGAAAMLGPWLGGWLFDVTGGYRLALAGAGAAALAAGVAMLALPQPAGREDPPQM